MTSHVRILRFNSKPVLVLIRSASGPCDCKRCPRAQTSAFICWPLNLTRFERGPTDNSKGRMVISVSLGEELASKESYARLKGELGHLPIAVDRALVNRDARNCASVLKLRAFCHALFLNERWTDQYN
ncbi:hypothetical protein PanWU01x14_145160 [Parasponia andersonii]|uniref:Uncharacterized protein n=1 Tax=Parasponia andersonii TaxID=3476 RepID=A0A2P5CKM5_PARAD|nr:hypothetical protein PanWU01x14_145160 [Parasponia andersonii]